MATKKAHKKTHWKNLGAVIPLPNAHIQASWAAKTLVTFGVGWGGGGGSGARTGASGPPAPPPPSHLSFTVPPQGLLHAPCRPPVFCRPKNFSTWRWEREFAVRGMCYLTSRACKCRSAWPSGTPFTHCTGQGCFREGEAIAFCVSGAGWMQSTGPNQPFCGMAHRSSACPQSTRTS